MMRLNSLLGVPLISVDGCGIKGLYLKGGAYHSFPVLGSGMVGRLEVFFDCSFGVKIQTIMVRGIIHSIFLQP